MLKNVFKDKEGEISSLRKQVFQAKEDGKTEFRNSDAFLYELDGCFVDGFNNCLHQVKASFLDLELSQTLTPRPRPQPNPSSLKVPTSCSRLIPLLTLKVTERLLYKMNRLNPSRMRTILLRKTRWLIKKRSWTRRPPLTSLRF